MDDQERERIISEARRNIDPVRRRTERVELAKRLMSQPLEDKVEKWKRDAEEREACRVDAKRAMRQHQEAAAADNAASWSSWVEDKIKVAQEFIFEVVGISLGEATEELRKELIAKLGDFARIRDHEKTMWRRELDLFDERLKITREIYNKDLTRLERQVMALRGQVDQLNIALNLKRTDAKVDATRGSLSEEIDKARQDIADLKLKLH
jgi:hypothetical protein